MPDELVNVRYMVDDVETAVGFYTTHFGFTVRSNAAPAFADVVRGHLRLLLSGPTSSAGRPMPDGRTPGREAGTASTSSSSDIDAEVERLRAAGADVPQRHRQRPGRPADPARRSRRQPDRAVPARRVVSSVPHATHQRPSARRGDRRSGVDDRGRGPTADCRPSSAHARLRRGLLHARRRIDLPGRRSARDQDRRRVLFRSTQRPPRAGQSQSRARAVHARLRSGGFRAPLGARCRRSGRSRARQRGRCTRFPRSRSSARRSPRRCKCVVAAPAG